MFEALPSTDGCHQAGNCDPSLPVPGSGRQAGSPLGDAGEGDRGKAVALKVSGEKGSKDRREGEKPVLNSELLRKAHGNSGMRSGVEEWFHASLISVAGG